jgi:hypothetical protein
MWTYAPQKLGLLWRILAYAPHKYGLVKSVVVPHRVFYGACLRHRSLNFYSACWYMRHRKPFAHVQWWTPQRFYGASLHMRHRKASLCGAPPVYAPHNLQNLCGACNFMRHRNNFVEHAPLGAPQMVFLPIMVFLVVSTLLIAFYCVVHKGIIYIFSRIVQANLFYKILYFCMCLNANHPCETFTSYITLFEA